MSASALTISPNLKRQHLSVQFTDVHSLIRTHLKLKDLPSVGRQFSIDLLLVKSNRICLAGCNIDQLTQLRFLTSINGATAEVVPYLSFKLCDMRLKLCYFHPVLVSRDSTIISLT